MALRKLFGFTRETSDERLLRMMTEYEDKENSNLIFFVDNFWYDLSRDHTPENTVLRHHIMEIDDHPLFLERINAIESDLVKKTRRLDIIFNTHGGSVQSSDIIANILINYPRPIYCYVPMISQSAGTLLALTGDRLYMNFYSIMGPVDPQLTYQGEDTDFDDTSSRCLLELKELKSIDEISDTILVKIIESEFLHEDGKETIMDILRKKKATMSQKLMTELCEYLCSGKYPHHKPINREKLEQMGVHVDGDTPEPVNKLFDSLVEYIHDTVKLHGRVSNRRDCRVKRRRYSSKK